MGKQLPKGIADTRPRRNRWRLADIAEFLHHHGDGLEGLVQAVGDPWIVRDVENATLMIHDDQVPACAIIEAMARTQEYLAEVSTPRLQSAAKNFPGADFFAAWRWYGARLGDLLAR